MKLRILPRINGAFEGCEKSPSAVILAFFSGTSSLTNTRTSTVNLNQYYDAGKIVFLKNKNVLSFSYTKEKNYSNRFEF